MQLTGLKDRPRPGPQAKKGAVHMWRPSGMSTGVAHSIVMAEIRPITLSIIRPEIRHPPEVPKMSTKSSQK